MDNNRPVLGQTFQIFSTPHLPKHLLAVSKSDQELYHYTQHSSTRILDKHVCSTGSVLGDKFYEGDQKTPEGIYFLEQKIEQELDFELYGDLAYALNYPNPVDKIKGKTGYGIWIHGRGKPLLPRDTRGCVAIETKKLHELSLYIDLGRTPVIIGSKIEHAGQAQQISSAVQKMHGLVQGWARAWNAKSNGVFSFYHPKRFSRSGSGPFQEFKAQSLESFSNYQWIELFIDQTRVVPGNDYWVTYFQQYQRYPGFSLQGVKRLYWQNIQEEWKIVGQEWRHQELGLEPKYLAQRKKSIRPWLDNWVAAWQNADLEAYGRFYLPQAMQHQTKGLDNILRKKEELWAQEPPASIKLQNIQITIHKHGFEISFEQTTQGAQSAVDQERKILIVQPHAQDFRILCETWESIQCPASENFRGQSARPKEQNGF